MAMNKEEEWFTQDEMRIWLAMRIRRENFFHGGVMPPQSVLFWKGFLAGCSEGNGITGADYWYLMGLLPPIDNDPCMDIMLGRDELPDEDVIQQLEPLTIPQVIVTEEKYGNEALTSAGPVPITKPKFINGRLNDDDTR
jgi:hypothetical protein